jgi:hypothetical protein
MPDINMMGGMPRPDNHEAAMARADLYKLANYSFKLFKMIKDGQELEGWVQAKVTKAADYIASVYHFMEYEMKFSEYGEKLETADVYSEQVKREYKRKLTEARVKLEKLRKQNIATLDEGWEDMMKASKERGEKEKKEKGTGKFDVKKTSTGTQYTRKASTFNDGGKDKDLKKAEKKVKEGSIQGGVWTSNPPKKGQPNVPVPSPDEGPTTPTGKKELKKAPVMKTPPRGKNPTPQHVDDPVREALKGGQKKLDVDKDGKLEKSDFAKLRSSKGVKEAEEKCNHSPKGKSCPVHGLKECGPMESIVAEKAKPSAGMSKAEKSAVVKKAKAGGDIGKPGKGFAKVEKAAKSGGAKNPKAVAAAAMWKAQAKK